MKTKQSFQRITAFALAFVLMFGVINWHTTTEVRADEIVIDATVTPYETKVGEYTVTTYAPGSGYADVNEFVLENTGSYKITGDFGNAVFIIPAGADIQLTIERLNVKRNGSSYAPIHLTPSTDSDPTILNLIVNDVNTIEAGFASFSNSESVNRHEAIFVPKTTEIIIKGSGQLTSKTINVGAAIGSGGGSAGSTRYERGEITITDNVEVIALSANDAVGIGGACRTTDGYTPDLTKGIITISENAKVTASGSNAAAIGGIGHSGTIIIKDYATVNAIGGAAAAIGGRANGGLITIHDTASVTATNTSRGAAIGGGESYAGGTVSIIEQPDKTTYPMRAESGVIATGGKNTYSGTGIGGGNGGAAGIVTICDTANVRAYAYNNYAIQTTTTDSGGAYVVNAYFAKTTAGTFAINTGTNKIINAKDEQGIEIANIQLPYMSSVPYTSFAYTAPVGNYSHKSDVTGVQKTFAPIGSVSGTIAATKDLSVKVPLLFFAPKPTIDLVVAGADVITGTGYPGSTVNVTLPKESGGTVTGTATVNTTPNNKGEYVWTIKISEVQDAKGLVAADKVSATQTTDGEISVKVEVYIPNPAPTIDTVNPGDKVITGTGDPSATITVTLPDGSTIPNIEVDDSTGVWTATVPDAAETLEAGDKIVVVQIKGGGSSGDVVTYVSIDPPTIHLVKEGAKEITGTGISGAEVTVTLPKEGSSTGETVTGTATVSTTADANGDYIWTLDLNSVTDVKDLAAGDTISANQTVKTQTSNDVSVVIPNPAPTVDVVNPGDDKITGTGDPGATITITLPDGTKLPPVDVETDGTWGVDVPEGKEPESGDKIIVEQIKGGGSSGDLVVVVPVTPPTVNPIVDGDKEISGTGEPGGTIVITYPKDDGTIGEIKIPLDKDGDGTWTVTIPPSATSPDGETLNANDKVVVEQIKGGGTSGNVTVIVEPKPPTIDLFIKGQTTISGTGEKDAVVKVTLPKKDSTTGETVDYYVTVGSTPNANNEYTWTLGISSLTDVKELVKPDKIFADQTVGGKLENGVLTGGVTSGKADRDVVDKTPNPTIDVAIVGDTTVSGTGEKGADVIVIITDKDGKNPITIIGKIDEDPDEDGNYNWTVTLPGDGKLKDGDKIDVEQIIGGKEVKDGDGSVTGITGGNKSEKEHADVIVRTEKPTINVVTVGDARVGGTGIPNATITVTFPSGEVVTTTVGGKGNWEVTIPDADKNFGTTSIITANQTVDVIVDEIVVGVNKSDDAKAVIKEKTIATAPDKPTIDDVNVGDLTISGTAEAGNTVFVEVGGKRYQTAAGNDGNWTITLDAGTVLIENEAVTATQQKGTGPASDKETTYIKPQTPTPTVDKIVEGAKTITGTGEAGNTIVVTLPNGETKETIVDKDGSWTIDVPTDVILVKDDEITVVQKDKDNGKASLPVVEKVVADTTNPTTVIHAQDTTIEVAARGFVVNAANVDEIFASILEKSKFTIDEGYELAELQADGETTVPLTANGKIALLKSVKLSKVNSYGMELRAMSSSLIAPVTTKSMTKVFRVKVIDTQAPVITPVTASFSYGLNSNVGVARFLLDVGAVVSDNNDDNVLISVADYSNVNFNADGSYDVTLTSSDKSGNLADARTYTIDITDTAPVIIDNPSPRPDVVIDAPTTTVVVGGEQATIDTADTTTRTIPLAGGYTAVANDDGTFDLFDENGTALGAITIPEGKDISTMTLDELLPLAAANVTPDKANPKTGDVQETYVALILIALAIGAFTLFFIRRATKQSK